MSRLAITCGDPAGVGPEIIAGWLAANPAEAAGATVIGPARWLETLPVEAQRIAVGLDDFAAKPGQPDGDGALVAWAAMERAAAGCRLGEFSGVVTAPVSKERLAAIGYPFPGQTEFFAARWGGEPVMCFCGGKLRVALATWHVPLHEVVRVLGPNLLQRTVAAADQLAKSDGVAVPRIGVCGLNPHAGRRIFSIRLWPRCSHITRACLFVCRAIRFSRGHCAASSTSSSRSTTTRAWRRSRPSISTRR
jgi:4-hydroxythreonine-4-phosphate dehydrogenase